MNNKLTSAISKINLTAATINGEEYAATFHGEVMTPTFVNFGYGNNGTGKSSVAKAIQDDVGIEWAHGKSAPDYNVLVYNHQFITDHFANYSYLPGIYTMGEKNIEIQKQINANTAAAKKHRDNANLSSETKALKERERKGLFPSYHDTFWQLGATIREDFKKIFTGNLQKATFANACLENKAVPTQHNVKALKELYDVAYGGTPETPDAFDIVNITSLKRLTEFALLDISIVSRDDSNFSRFIKALNATDWIKRGLDRFVPHTKGRCPFCQQELPHDFMEQIAACFDEHYQEDINALRQHRADYERCARDLHGLLKNNLGKNVYSKFSKEQKDLYTSKVNAVGNTLKLNLQTLDAKLAEPSKTVELESVEELCNELNAIIAEYNRQVQANKAIIADIRNQKKSCEKQVWELLAYETQALIAKYRADDKKLYDELVVLTNQINADVKAASTLDAENAKLNKQIVSIKTAVDGINRLLHDSGFQGFELRVYEGSGQSAYRVIRPHTGKVAKNLSEGELNFVGFLYFYFLVQGSHSDEDISKEKIVVIDDPVSSMDATVLHIVGMLTHDIIDACLYGKRIKGVKQVFVLTHNVHYHTKVANQFVPQYKVASYFLLKKTNNHSTITHCIQDNPNIADEKENYNPVPSEYTVLWKDYKNVTTSKMLRSLIWQILDYYFIKLCGGNGDDLRERVLIDNRENFIEHLPNGIEDSSKLMMAAKLLSYMGTATQGNDEVFYADDDGDTDGIRETFAMVFAAMGQNQHYNMMMSE